MVAQMISELPPLKTISNIFQSKSRIILFMSLIIFTILGIVFCATDVGIMLFVLHPVFLLCKLLKSV